MAPKQQPPSPQQPQPQKTASFRHRVEEMYRMYRPDEIAKVDVAMNLRETTSEAQILTALYNKFGVDPLTHKRNRLTDFYRRNAPDQMQKVEFAMQMDAEEEELMAKLFQKYNLTYPPPASYFANPPATAAAAAAPAAGATAAPVASSPPQPSPVPQPAATEDAAALARKEARVVKFLQENAPKHLKKVPQIMAMNIPEDELMARLQEKYGAAPAGGGAAPAAAAASTPETQSPPASDGGRELRIRAFFEQHAPQAMDRLPAVLAMTAPEEEIMAKLRDKYLAPEAAPSPPPAPAPAPAPRPPTPPQSSALPQATAAPATLPPAASAPPVVVQQPVPERAPTPPTLAPHQHQAAPGSVVVSRAPTPPSVATPQRHVDFGSPHPAPPAAVMTAPTPAPTPRGSIVHAADHNIQLSPLLQSPANPHVVYVAAEAVQAEVGRAAASVSEVGSRLEKCADSMAALHAQLAARDRDNATLAAKNDELQRTVTFLKTQIDSERSLQRNVQSREEALAQREIALSAVEAAIDAKARALAVVDKSPGSGFSSRYAAVEMETVNANARDNLQRFQEHLVQIEAQLFEKCLQLQAHRDICATLEKQLIDRERAVKEREERLATRERLRDEADSRQGAELAARKAAVTEMTKQADMTAAKLRAQAMQLDDKEKDLVQRERAVAVRAEEVEVKAKSAATQVELLERERESCRKLSNDILKREATVRSVEKSLNIARAELTRLEEDVTARARRLIEEEEAIKKWSIEVGKKEANANALLQQLRHEKGSVH